MTNDRKVLFRERFDRDASEYDRFARYAWVRATYRFILDETLKYDFQSCLDVGCGTGNLLSRLGKQRQSAKLFGIDLSEEMIKVARAKLRDKADLRVADSERLPFEAGKFDLITCTYSFHHYPNPIAVLTEMRRVLADGGKLILVDPWIPTPSRLIINFLSLLPKDEAFHSKKEMFALVESAGLTVSKWVAHWRGYLLVAEKCVRLQ